MMNRLQGWVGAASAPLLAKLAVGIAGAAVAAALGVWLWVSALEARNDQLREKLDRAHRVAGQQDSAIQALELDAARLRAALDEQSVAVQRMADAAKEARAVADRRAKELADRPPPPAEEGAAAMLEWWSEHVVQ